MAVKLSRPENRAAKGAARSVEPVPAACLVGAVELVEVTVGIQGFVAKVVVETAMKLLRAALGDEVEVRTRHLAVGRRVAGLQHRDLLDSIHVGWGIEGVATAGVAGNSVHRYKVVLVVNAVDRRRRGGAETG